METTLEVRTRTKKQLTATTGGLSAPGKMPGSGWSIPAQECNVGSRLRKIKGSVCEGCYALKFRYLFKNVKDALGRRLALWRLAQGDPIRRQEWRESMAESIRRDVERTGVAYFRWFDSGDLQGRDMLDDIIAVCRMTPAIKHWLPTRETGILATVDLDEIPGNLVIRLSAAMVNGPRPAKWRWTSTVYSKPNKPTGRACPAYQQEGQCGDCRSCWDKRVVEISYPKH
tara:strand:- start:82 stop:765 length:684 start_codon:yes stop_codon:yes gene_type:complete